MTEAEKKIWYRVKDKQLGIKFRRQQPIGNHIVDFVCFKKKLVIEIDGGEHFENGRDKIRDKWFQEQGYKVLRFWNNDVLVNPEGVLETIMEKLSPSPLPHEIQFKDTGILQEGKMLPYSISPISKDSIISQGESPPIKGGERADGG